MDGADGAPTDGSSVSGAPKLRHSDRPIEAANEQQ